MKLGMKAMVLFNRIPQAMKAADKGLEDSLEQIAKDVEAHVQNAFREAKHGRTYIIGGKSHTASAPGEAPAILTGDLAASVRHYKESQYEWRVPAEGVQAWWEFGLPQGAERPYLRPAADEAGRGMAEVVATNLKGELMRV